MESSPSGFLKVNTDAVTFEGGRYLCIRVVIRDSMVEILAASSKVLPASFSAKISKALAIQEGMLLAAEMEVSHAIFESNALSTIQTINDGIHGGELGHIIRNIREVSSSFTWCSFQHLKREGNRVAHELARVAGNLGASQVWKRAIPSLVKHLITEDLCL